jgi:hypothetical protein
VNRHFFVAVGLFVAFCISSGAKPDALAAGYAPQYVDVDTFFLSNPNNISVNATLLSEGVVTNTDANGGYIYEYGQWLPVSVCPKQGSCFSTGGYSSQGYINFGLPFNLPSWSSLVDTEAQFAQDLMTGQVHFGLPPFPTDLLLNDPKPQSVIDFTNYAGNTLNNAGAVLGTPGADAACTFAAVAGCALLPPPFDLMSCSAINSAGQVCNNAGIIIRTAGAGFQAIANDPIDPNFRGIATPGPSPGLIADVVPGFTQDQQAAWTDLIAALDDIVGLPDAIQTAYNRAEGAFLGGDQIWEEIQLYAADQYAGLAQDDLTRIVTDAGILGIDLSAPAPVPEPGTLPLLGGALLVWLVWVSRPFLPGPLAARQSFAVQSDHYDGARFTDRAPSFRLASVCSIRPQNSGFSTTKSLA